MKLLYSKRTDVNNPKSFKLRKYTLIHQVYISYIYHFSKWIKVSFSVSNTRTPNPDNDTVTNCVQFSLSLSIHLHLFFSLTINQLFFFFSLSLSLFFLLDSLDFASRRQPVCTWSAFFFLSFTSLLWFGRIVLRGSARSQSCV